MARENFKDIQVTVEGETKTLQQWAADLGLNYMTVCARYRNGKRGGELLRQTNPATTQPADLRGLLGDDVFGMLVERAQEVGLQPLSLARYLIQQGLLEKTT